MSTRDEGDRGQNPGSGVDRAVSMEKTTDVKLDVDASRCKCASKRCERATERASNRAAEQGKVR